MNTNVLTPTRVEEAIEWVAKEKIITDVQHYLEATRIQKTNQAPTLNVLNTIHAALDAVQWRDPAVEEPVDDEKVLVCTQTKKGVKSINIAYIDADGVWHGMGSMSGVIAWLPLPAVVVWEGDEE